MKRAAWQYELVVVTAVVAVLTAVGTIGFFLASGGLIALALLATPWVFAAWLLWRAWWDGTGSRLSAMDGPAWLLAIAVGALPDDRRAWGSAMTAELAQVSGQAERWQFAAGCARAALFPPGRHITSDPVVGGAGLVGVTVCVAVTADMLVNHPSAADALEPALAVVLAAVLAGALWLVLAPPPVLTSSRLARRVGVGAALALGAGLVAVSRLALPDDIWVEGGVLEYLFLVPVVILLVGSAIAAAAARSFRAGVEAALWSALLGALAAFAIGLVEALHWHRIDGRLILDGEAGYAVGENLADFIFWGFLLLPSWSLPFGVIGAGVGSAVRGRRRASPDISAPGPRPGGHTITL